MVCGDGVEVGSVPYLEGFGETAIGGEKDSGDGS